MLKRKAPSSTPGNAFQPWRLAWLGALLYWLTLEPVGWWPLGWVALTPWFLIAGLRPYGSRRESLQLYAAGTALWLVALYGLIFAHPAMFLGWIALSAYLGVYIPVAVALIRTAIGYRIPLWLAGPVVWTGLEWVRGYALTGFSAGLLGHSQADVPVVIQIADAFGSYAVSFVLALVAAVIAEALCGRLIRRDERAPHEQTAAAEPPAAALSPRRPWVGIIVGVLCIAATLVYGNYRLRQIDSVVDAEDEAIHVALIQRSEPVEYVMTQNRQAEIFRSYVQGTRQAVAEATEPIDLVVWPESMFNAAGPWMELADGFQPPPEAPRDRTSFAVMVQSRRDSFQETAKSVQRMLQTLQPESPPPALLVGTSTIRFEDRMQSFSGAVLVDASSRVEGWYGKRHLVMFGEYIPLTEWFPLVHDWIAMPRVTPGDRAVVFQVAGYSVAPNICFETAVECVTIDQVRQLSAGGQHPDILVNLTNDAWFRGTPVLDHHRRCSQFAAVASRTPLLMASNDGPTAAIDSSGRILQILPKQTDGHLRVRPQRDGRWGLYQAVGDRPLWLLGLAVVALAGITVRDHRRAKRRSKSV